jgi:heme iron utilization protein
MDTQARDNLRQLLHDCRWAALATNNAHDSAEIAQIAFALSFEPLSLLFHLSTLAKHTRNLLERPQCALSIFEADDGRADPQTLARVSLSGSVANISRDALDYAHSKSIYLARLPMAEPRFDFGDFHLFRMSIAAGQYVGGFARAFRVNSEDLATL